MRKTAFTVISALMTTALAADSTAATQADAPAPLAENIAQPPTPIPDTPTPLEVRRGNTASTDTRMCRVVQGDGITMLSCPNSYEIYNTAHYAVDWHMQPDNGSLTKRVMSARLSSETNHPGTITYLEDNSSVVRVSTDADGKIVKTGVMSVNVPTFDCIGSKGRVKVDGCTV